VKRRSFLHAGAVGSLAASAGLFASCEMRDGALGPNLVGAMSGPDMALGHALRERSFPAPSETIKLDIAIVGAGIGGMSAAWWLARNKVQDFRIFELESVIGGNSRSARAAAGAYPLGAHYLPLPSSEARDMRLLLSDLGVLQGDPNAAKPRFDERMLVHAPQDRLWLNGLWQEGLSPRHAISERDLIQLGRFDALMQEFKALRGADGARLFALPSVLASRDARTDALDQLTMQAWLIDQGLDAPALHWLVNYACRDDYGTPHDQTSAYAGIHYFACRDGLAQDADPQAVLTWPEGNGFLVRKLEEWLLSRLSTASRANAIQVSAACTRLITEPGRALLDVYLAAEKRSIRVEAKRLIWAAPAFVLAQVWDNAPPSFKETTRVETSPWLTATLTLKEPPPEREGVGAGLAWDNVLYQGAGLGYVVANHQTLRVTAPFAKPHGQTLITYYWPLTAQPPREARRALAETPWQQFARTIINELEVPHPGIAKLVERIDLWRWPHAMPRPTPGFRSHPLRAMLKNLRAPLAFAHSDLSGLSLFEEAHQAGVLAARQSMGAAQRISV
jgi:protoporphyrinogen oxidase